MNDIDLSSVADWEGITLEEGTFDGNGHVIKNLKSTQSGLFKDDYDTIYIKNLGLENVNINSTKNSIGALINDVSDTHISNCYAQGTVKGNDYVGGLVGYCSYYHSGIENSYFKGTVSGNSYVGGLMGECDTYDDGIYNCYAEGYVSGNNYVGGLLGRLTNAEKIQNTFSKCIVDCKTEGIAGSLFGEIDFINNNNVFSNVYSLKSSKYDIVGKYTGSTQFTNIKELTEGQFNDSSNWNGFSSNVWDKSSFPPTLKNMPPAPKGPNFNGSNEFRIQTGTNSDANANALVLDTGIYLNNFDVDFSNPYTCLESAKTIRTAIDTVAQKTADIGVAQRRLESISTINTTKIENLSAAHTTVTGADVAEEVANFTKAQIMAQTTASLITQTQAFQANLLLRMINSLG